MIYKTWADYWSRGNHGYSSGSKEYAKDIWDDFQDTINAVRTDYENILINQAVEQEKHLIARVQQLHKYLSTYDLEKHATKKFFRWLLEEELRK